MGLKISLKTLKDMINNHETFIVNYGKGYLGNYDIKEKATWDDELKAYTSDTGIWSLKLLYEIANGEVEDASIEVEYGN